MDTDYYLHQIKLGPLKFRLLSRGGIGKSESGLPRIRYVILWSDPLELFSGAWLRVVTAISCCQLISCNPVATLWSRLCGVAACAYLAFSVSPRHLHNVIIPRPPSRAINRSIDARNSSQIIFVPPCCILLTHYRANNLGAPYKVRLWNRLSNRINI